MNTLYFLKAYNDLDHFSPMIFKELSDGRAPRVLVFSDQRFKADYRLAYLKKCGLAEVDFLSSDSISASKKKSLILGYWRQFTGPHGFIGKVIRRFFLDCTYEIDYLNSHNIGALVLEWSTPYSNGLGVERFFRAAKGLGVRTLALPHGCNINTHPDVSLGYRKNIQKGKFLDTPGDRGMFDYYVFQGRLRRNICVQLGYDPLRTQAWGSCRFEPSWQKLNLSICPPVPVCLKDRLGFKLVFMDHQYDYNVDTSAIWSTLYKLAAIEGLTLVIKTSTREGKSAHVDSYRNKLSNLTNVVFVNSEVHSPSLIQWSDCVVNYGSSIGIEAIMQNKPLITPTYMHSNRTLFEDFGAGVVVHSAEELLVEVERLISGESPQPYADAEESLLREIVYGGRENKFNVAGFYIEQISSKYLNY